MSVLANVNYTRLTDAVSEAASPMGYALRERQAVNATPEQAVARTGGPMMSPAEYYHQRMKAAGMRG
jgi:hypothetical protein